MNTSIIGKKLLFITAHPDDESFLAAGTISLNHLHGGTNTLFCASLGGKGTAYMDKTLPEAEVKRIRKSELHNAASYLRITQITIADFPDGSIENHIEKLEKEIIVFLATTSPDYIVSFGEDGFTGHKDHIAVGKVAKKIADRLQISFMEFSRPPISLCPNLDEYLFAKRVNGTYVDQLEKNEPNIHIAINEKIKLNALKIHKSQFLGINPHKKFPEEIALHLLNNEYFYQYN